ADRRRRQGERPRRLRDHQGGREDEPAHQADARRHRRAEAGRRPGGEGHRLDRPRRPPASRRRRADNDGGHPAGLEYEILEYYAKTSGRSLDVHWTTSWETIVDEIVKGHADVAG